MLSLCAFSVGLASILTFDFIALGISVWILGIKLYYGYSDIVTFFVFLPIFFFITSIMSKICLYTIHGYMAYSSVYWKKYTIKTSDYSTLGLLMFGTLGISFALLGEQNNLMLFAKKFIGVMLFYPFFLFLWFIPAHYDAINEYRKRIIKM